jgi:hypothetical protein
MAIDTKTFKPRIHTTTGGFPDLRSGQYPAHGVAMCAGSKNPCYWAGWNHQGRRCCRVLSGRGIGSAGRYG